MENKLQTNKNSSILNKNDSNIYINEKIGPFRITNKILGEGSTGKHYFFVFIKNDFFDNKK